MPKIGAVSGELLKYNSAHDQVAANDGLLHPTAHRAQRVLTSDAPPTDAHVAIRHTAFITYTHATTHAHTVRARDIDA